MWNTGCYIRCTGISEEREKLMMTMREKVDLEWQSMEDDERVAAVLSNPGNNLYIRDQRRGDRYNQAWAKKALLPHLLHTSPYSIISTSISYNL